MDGERKGRDVSWLKRGDSVGRLGLNDAGRGQVSQRRCEVYF